MPRKRINFCVLRLVAFVCVCVLGSAMLSRGRSEGDDRYEQSHVRHTLTLGSLTRFPDTDDGMCVCVCPGHIRHLLADSMKIHDSR